MGKPQFIKTQSGEELVVLSRRDYDSMRARLGDEEAEDAMDARILKERAGDVAFPLSVWDEIHAAPSPMGPIRKWRGLTQDDLAEKAGISQGYLSELETGKKTGDIATLRGIAAVLGVGLDDVTHEIALRRGRGKPHPDHADIDALAFPMEDVATRKRVWAKVDYAYLEDLAWPHDHKSPTKIFEAYRERIERLANARYLGGMNPPLIREGDA